MALPNNPTPAELVKEVKELDSTKLDKISTANRVYGTDSNGNQTSYALANASNVGNAVAKYDTAGRLKANTPSANDDVTNKTYVDTRYTNCAHLDEDVTFDSINVSGIYELEVYDLTANNSITTNGTLDVGGDATLYGDVNISGDIIMGNGTISYDRSTDTFTI